MPMNRTPYEKLAQKLEQDAELLRKADAVLRRHQRAKAEKTFPAKLKAAAKLRGPKRATNGSGRIIPVTVPTNLTSKQQKGLNQYLIHQMTSSSSEPVSLGDILASLRAVRRKVHPTVMASALKNGIVKRGPGFRASHRTYIAGRLPPAFNI